MNEADRLLGLLFREEINCTNSTLDKSATDTDLSEEQYYQTNYSATISTEDKVLREPERNFIIDVSVCPAQEPESVHWSTSNWAESENGTAPLTPAEMATLVDLIQEMRSSNNNLLERVIQLEQTLADCQNDVQLYKQRSRNAESMLIQKSQDLADASEQVQDLSDELKTAHHAMQQQESLTENLTTQLMISQERVAQMERECALTQANYNEKFHQLIQSENSCRELRTRLIRQQRYTMQLKFALEKCLEVPNYSYQFPANENSMWNTSNGQTVYDQQAQCLFPKAQPITPWSVQTLSSNGEPSSTWAESSKFCGSSVEFNQFARSTDNFVEPDCTVISSNKQRTIEQSSCFTEDITMTKESDWQDLLDLNWFETEDEETANAAEDLVADNVPDLNMPSSAPDLSNQTNQFQPLKSSQPNHNWPSPLVYPCRPPKGRKSLSAIELPTFNKQ